jgi:subtilase-type serine protease
MPHPRRRSAALLASLSSVALLSGCGGGGENVVDLSGYLPNFAAPPPILFGLLTQSIDQALLNQATANVSNLLSQNRYSGSGAGLPWLRNNVDAAVPNGVTNNPLQSSGAAFAHAAGFTGAGQLIAFSDSHISPSHTSLGGRVVLLTDNAPDEICENNQCRDDEHATSVTSVALGSSPTFIGVAPGATGIYGYYGEAGDWEDLFDLGQFAIAGEAVAWNNSWGFDGLYVNTDGFNAAFAGAEGSFYLATLSQYAVARTDIKDEGVVVFAVSNTDSGNAGIMDGLPYLRQEFEAGWLAVANGVPTLSGTDVTSVYLLSSPCYQSARWCLVADGTWNAAVGPTNDYAFTTGSSFAAPQVAGALALLSEAFPLLSPHELRVRLLASAEDDFFNADATVELAAGFNKPYSVIYGHGFLDIEAALKPIGGTAMITSLGETVATNAPVLLTGSGFGDAVEVSLADTNVAVRDALSAGFVMPGTALTAGARPSSQAGALLAKAMRSDLAAARTATPAALSDPFAAFTGPVLSMSAADGTGSAAVLVPQGDGALGFTLTRVLTDGPTKVELGLKLARDNCGLLSLDGEDGAAMASVALGVTQDLGNGAFMALSGEMGLTDLGGDTALGNTSSARFDAVKLTAGQSDIFTKGDRLSVGVGMPIAIAQGETVLDLPVSRSGLAAGFEGVALDLAPENRQLDMELTYQTALADGVEMQLSIIHSDNFGNRAGETDTAGALAFAFRF